jgi:hypothetical protein
LLFHTCIRSLFDSVHEQRICSASTETNSFVKCNCHYRCTLGAKFTKKK